MASSNLNLPIGYFEIATLHLIVALCLYINFEPQVRYAMAFFFALIMSIRGYRKKSLNLSGAVTAFIVGFTTFGVSYRFGLSLLTFYISCSKLTKYKQHEKQLIEHDFKKGGQRNYIQVLSNSLFAVVIAIVFQWKVEEEDMIPVISFEQKGLRAFLFCAYYAGFASCNADTWASEVGVLDKNSPFLITTGRKVPAGTNGGISPLGICMSICGGAFIGLQVVVMDLLWFFCVPGIDNRTINKNFAIWLTLDFLTWLFFCAFLGLLGSVLDSLLGATLQATWFNAKNKKIINSKKEVERLKIEGEGGEIKWICGWDVLTNDQVNLVSSVIISLLGGFIGKRCFAPKMPYF